MRTHLFEEWSDFYYGEPTQTYGTSTSQIIITTSGNVSVSNAIFEELSVVPYGGAIYCKQVSILFLSEKCSYINLTSTNLGGAIYIYITGESILSKVCGYGCVSSNGNFQFDYIRLNDDATKRNTFSDVSVCHSIHNNDYGHVIYCAYGKINLNSVNSSQNECYNDAGIVCEHQSGENCCIVEYCSITNCTAKSYYCIGLTSSYQKQVRSCNILYNKQLGTSTSLGLIHSNTVFTIENSCILGNEAICQVSGKHGSTISVCTIDFNSSVVYGVTITNIPKESFINKVSCFATAL